LFYRLLQEEIPEKALNSDIFQVHPVWFCSIIEEKSKKSCFKKGAFMIKKC
jgi:hypothetical protein